jgi:sodium-dependent phosphate cotransporter
MIIGTRIGTSITALFVAFLIHAKRRDFRHGFEIGLANLVYAIPIAIIMFLLEFSTKFFYKTGEYFVVFGSPFKHDFIEIIVSPLINLLSFIPDHLKLVFGVLILIGSLKYIPKFMINIWGEQYLKRKINSFLDKKWRSFWLGLGVTALLISTSITITFLIPLVVLRITNLKRVIPYMIGANLGGVSEMILGGIVLGGGALPAVFTYVSFSLIGLFWMFNTDLLFKATKFLSKRTLHISRKRALMFIIAFVLIALILSFI